MSKPPSESDDRDLESGRVPHVESFPPDFAPRKYSDMIEDFGYTPNKLQWIKDEIAAGRRCATCGSDDSRGSVCPDAFHQAPLSLPPSYDKMISRNTTGSDPLVQEPKK